jgi:hypothetical protein
MSNEILKPQITDYLVNVNNTLNELSDLKQQSELSRNKYMNKVTAIETLADNDNGDITELLSNIRVKLYEEEKNVETNLIILQRKQTELNKHKDEIKTYLQDLLNTYINIVNFEKNNSNNLTSYEENDFITNLSGKLYKKIGDGSSYYHLRDKMANVNIENKDNNSSNDESEIKAFNFSDDCTNVEFATE